MFKEGYLFFNKIYILESLRPEDSRTGKDLYDDLISRLCLQKGSLQSEYFNIESRQQLVHALGTVQKEVLESGIFPYLHFETHGYEGGIEINSVNGHKEFFEWKDLLGIIRSININSKNNLYISVAACNGGSIQHLVKITEPAPFRGFIGPINKIYPNDILASFTGFFDTLIRTDDFDRAIDNLNKTSYTKFHYMNCEAFFNLMLSITQKKLNDQKAQSIVSSLWKNNPGVKAKFQSKGQLRKHILKNEISRIPDILGPLKRRFLHQD